MKDNVDLIYELCVKINKDFQARMADAAKTLVDEYATYWNNSPWYRKVYLWLLGFRRPKGE